jgi:hypothetical protein
MLSINKHMFRSIVYHRLLILSGYSLRHRTSSASTHRINSNKTNYQANTIRRLFQPIDVKPMVATDKFDSISSSNANIGQELTGGKTMERNALLRIITDFYRR